LMHYLASCLPPNTFNDSRPRWVYELRRIRRVGNAIVFCVLWSTTENVAGIRCAPRPAPAALPHPSTEYSAATRGGFDRVQRADLERKGAPTSFADGRQTRSRGRNAGQSRRGICPRAAQKVRLIIMLAAFEERPPAGEREREEFQQREGAWLVGVADIIAQGPSSHDTGKRSRLHCPGCSTPCGVYSCLSHERERAAAQWPAPTSGAQRELSTSRAASSDQALTLCTAPSSRRHLYPLPFRRPP
jgi:hypothetical protein